MHRNHVTTIVEEAQASSTLTRTDRVIARSGTALGVVGTASALGGGDWTSAAFFAAAAIGFALFSIERAPARAVRRDGA